LYVPVLLTVHEYEALPWSSVVPSNFLYSPEGFAILPETKAPAIDLLELVLSATKVVNVCLSPGCRVFFDTSTETNRVPKLLLLLFPLEEMVAAEIIGGLV
jgi:hypothetical protein